jgi:aldehyde:ferredoxin oxidoreductase
MIRGGFSGNILYVDLTHGTITKKKLDAALAEKYIGGLGLTIKLAYDEIVPGTDALSPGNPVVLGAGPLVGTNLPSSSRIYAVSKLPTSGTIGWCGAGGANFGYLFKNAGLDHVVIKGRADRPVYLKIMDDDVEICPADNLWGLGVEEADAVLRKTSENRVGVLAIGQAGENLVPFSMAFIDRISTLGRGGLGAVFGSKNLKAVIVRGTRGVRIADRRRYKALTRPFFKTIREYPYLKERQDLGLVKSFPMIPEEEYFGMKKRRMACVSCPIGCKDLVEIPDGEFQGLTKHTSSVINLYTPVLYGFKDYRESVKCMTTIDAYGLDMFEFFGIMRFARSLLDNGVIPPGLSEAEITLDSLASMEEWARKISYREGFGDILAGGFKKIIETFGEEAEKLSPALVKGMHPYAGPNSALPWHLFGTMELGQVLDPRGPHVGSGGSPTYFARRPLSVFPKHLNRMGVPEEDVARVLPGYGSADKEQELNVGRLLKHSHRWFSILGSLGICARAAINRFYSAELCAEFYETVTGIETDLPALRQRVDRVWTLLRMANLREGFAENDESPPESWFGTPGFKHYLTDEALAREEAEQMIGDYFEEWGWDRKSGIPSTGLLKELDLTDE